ncbi:unnamed protein product [Toxocara canis]|uniref:PDZ domain-containing protein n=1 Tax=Toxocara canis TaxID=6265 RepID=A0A183VF50_TOXCA|nr:unnamed protein product [Toxocara canis]
MILSKAEDLQSLEGFSIDFPQLPLFICSHITRETTYEDPRQTASQRTVYLYRDPNIGYGFVAASQRPVVVQFVSPAGPSSGKLFVNDQILNVNGVNVEDADKENVVDLIRKSSTQLTLIVSQVPSCQGTGVVILTAEGTRVVILSAEGTRVVILIGEGTRVVILSAEGTRVVILTAEGTRVVILSAEGTRVVILTGEGTRVVILTAEGTRVVILTGEGTRVVILTGEGTRVVILTGEAHELLYRLLRAHELLY